MPESEQDCPVLKGALHTHTTCSDGVLSPREVLRIYRELGFDFVALTDHDFLLAPNAYADVPDEYEGMLVFKGVEKTVFSRGYVHVNEIRGETEVLHVFNHPAEYDFTVNQVIACIAAVQAAMPIHAVEVTAKGYYTAEYDVETIPYPKVVSDDSHTGEGCGRAWIEVRCERNRDAIVRAIRNGNARICYKWTAPISAWARLG